MEYCSKIVDVDEDMVMEEIPNAKIIIAIILHIHRKGKPHFTTVSEVMVMQNKKMRRTYEINPLRFMKRLNTYME